MDSLKQEVKVKETSFLKLVADLKNVGSATGIDLDDKAKLKDVAFKDGEFRKADASNNVHWGWCVMVAEKNGVVAVRDSKDRSKTTLRFTVDEWRAFVEGVKAGEFDF